LRAVDFTAAAYDNFFLQAVDATAASFSVWIRMYESQANWGDAGFWTGLSRIRNRSRSTGSR
jgi:hypothetical protein